MENEIWKDVKGYEGYYQVSNLGNVKSFKKCKSGRLLKHYKNSDGYFVICLCVNYKSKVISVHQLVAIAFLGHAPNGCKMVVDHINNNKLDNRLENIQVITNRENSSKDKKGFTSKYVGVHFSKNINKWKSAIFINNKLNYLGAFKNEIDAHNAYQNALKQL